MLARLATTAHSDPTRADGYHAPKRFVVAAVAVVTLIPLAAACGGNSKPAYCSDLTSLQSSIKDLTNISLSGGVSGLKTKITTIQNDASTLVDSAKTDFPSETTAISTSVTTLKNALSSTSVNPTASQLLTVASASAGVVSSVKSFATATSSKC